MSHYDYIKGREIILCDPPFYAIIQAAMRKADTENLLRLQRQWPDTWQELQARHDLPNGLFPNEVESLKTH